MNEGEKKQLWTLKWYLENQYGKPAGQLESLKIIRDLLGTEQPPEVEPPAVTQSRQLWLSAGHGGPDPGITAHGRKEADEAIELRDLIKNRLTGFTVWTDPNNWKTSDTAPWLQSHTKGNDIVCDIHFNGYNGSAKGVEVIVPVSPTKFEVQLAQDLAKAIADILQSPLRGDKGMKTEAESQHKRLAMMRPPGENVLIEVCFLDNATEMDCYVEKRNAVADAIADVLRKALVV